MQRPQFIRRFGQSNRILVLKFENPVSDEDMQNLNTFMLGMKSPSKTEREKYEAKIERLALRVHQLETELKGAQRFERRLRAIMGDDNDESF